ncbi:energy transducer TonB [Sphingopyxis kveilinensis]|uniref:energy transducer TonB n=1 Tax=Sphingopyxis kveilinensis TaxID=3114367 RepID=UPI0030D22327
MLSWFFFAAAAVVEVSHPIKAEPKGSPANWVRAADLPKIDGRAATTTFDLTIDQAGHAVHCAVIIASGYDQLDTAVCAALIKRARFKPAKDIDGTAMAFVYRDRVVWRPKAYGSNSWFKSPDIVISTPAISNQFRKIAEILVVVDKTGDINNCFVIDSVQNGALDALACSAGKDPKISLPIMDAQGSPLRGVRSLYVGFEPGVAENRYIQ